MTAMPTAPEKAPDRRVSAPVVADGRRSIVQAMSEIARPATEKDVSDRALTPILAGIGVIIVFFGIFGGWAAYAPLASATIASGIVKIEANRKAVQHLDGGIVSEILVKDGDVVQADQVLVKLDDTRTRADYNLVAEQYDSLRTQAARLSAEFAGAKTIQFPADIIARSSDPRIAEAVQGQRRLLDARRSAFDSEIDTLRKQIIELEQQIKGTRAQIASRVTQRESMESEMKGLQELVDKGVIARTRVLAMQRDTSRLEGEEHELTSEVSRYESGIDQAKAKIDGAQQERLSQVVTELRQTQIQVSDVYNRMTSAKDVLDRTEIRAPVAGTVFDLNVFAKGAVIPRGETIMDIEPNDKEMRVEAQIKVEEIDRVKTGMDSEVRLTAFKQRNLPIISGKVTYVSPDRQVEAHTGKPYYTVYVKIDDASLAKAPSKLNLYPGMPASVIIATGERTALEYLMQPLIDSFSQAFREN